MVGQASCAHSDVHACVGNCIPLMRQVQERIHIPSNLRVNVACQVQNACLCRALPSETDSKDFSLA